MKTILVPTDFSPDAETALLYAIELAKRAKAGITLINAWHVLTGPFPYQESLNNVPDNDEIEKASQSKLNALKKKIGKKTGFDAITAMPVHGISTDAIRYFQDQHPHDLVVMGNRGMSNKKNLDLFGSTTNSMISAAEFPVLAIPNKYRFKNLNHFVYAADLHGSELKTVKELMTFSKLFNADLTLAHVIDKTKKSDELSLISKIKTSVNSRRLKVQAIESTNVVKGIEKYIREHDCDVLVMATYRRNFFENLFHTSISRRFAFKIKIPLLLYPKG